MGAGGAPDGAMMMRVNREREKDRGKERETGEKEGEKGEESVHVCGQKESESFTGFSRNLD
jgi:hypothetical protein